MSQLGQLLQSASKLHLPWTGTVNLSQINPLPRHFSFRHNKRRSKSRRQLEKIITQPEDITRLQNSFNPWDGVERLWTRSWRWTDVQYGVIALLMVFSLAIAPMPLLIQVLVPPVALLLCLMPATRQFFLPSMGIWVYLLYFFTSRYIPVEYRPHIWVKVLPALENILYGTNLSNILSAHTHPILDVLAWFPYGIGHFGAPAVCSLAMFIFAAPKTVPVFARTFGWLAITGVTMALVFPCTPPWYEKTQGLDTPAVYGMPGSPAGLARVDKLFGVDMYTTSFTTAPVPFGAFPSLHAANAVLEALFMSYCFPRLKPLFVTYVFWLWWATMYLNHHYAVDLVGGSLIAAGYWYVAKARYLPRQQADKPSRWAYTFVEIGEKAQDIDEEYGMVSSYEPGYGLGVLERPDSSGFGSEDESTLRNVSGGSSAAGSSRRGGSSGSDSSSSTLRSPSDAWSEDAQRMMHAGTVPMSKHYWEAEGPSMDVDLTKVVVVG